MNVKFLILVIASVLVFSCTKSPEDIMKQNFNKFIKEKYLLIPDSYKPARFEIKDTIYVRDLDHEIDSLHKLKTQVEGQYESICKQLQILENAYRNNEYHNVTKLRAFIKTRDETQLWLSVTSKRIDSLMTLGFKRTGDTWAGRNPNSVMFYKVLHTYEAKNKSGNNGVYVGLIYFDTTYAIYRFDQINY